MIIDADSHDLLCVFLPDYILVQLGLYQMRSRNVFHGHLLFRCRRFLRLFLFLSAILRNTQTKAGKVDHLDIAGHILQKVLEVPALHAVLNTVHALLHAVSADTHAAGHFDQPAGLALRAAAHHTKPLLLPCLFPIFRIPILLAVIPALSGRIFVCRLSGFHTSSFCAFFLFFFLRDFPVVSVYIVIICHGLPFLSSFCSFVLFF